MADDDLTYEIHIDSTLVGEEVVKAIRDYEMRMESMGFRKAPLKLWQRIPVVRRMSAFDRGFYLGAIATAVVTIVIQTIALATQ